MNVMRMDWPVFRLDSEGQLRDVDGDDLLYDRRGFIPTFESIQEAEDYLQSNDIRGSVRQ